MAKTPKIQGGVKAIAAKFEDAKRDIAAQKTYVDPDPNDPRHFEGYDGPVKPGQWEGAPWNRMPPECPVKILGKKGNTVYAVSATGDLMAIERWDHPTLTMLFAPYPNYMLWAWPAYGKEKKGDPENNIPPQPPKVERLARDKCVQCLISEAGRRGIFDPADQSRGRGGWKTADGEFVWHSGRELWMTRFAQKGKALEAAAMQTARPSEYQGYFYAQDSAIIEPWQAPIGYMDSPAHKIMTYLQTWNWERKWLDAVLYLGWIATAFMGAALEERPIIVVTGGRGVGKSQLHAITKAIFGRALYSTANTTAAGIYQNIKSDSRPVMVDEFEARARGEKEQSIIELARQAYSGAKLYRGGQNHDGVEFELRCSFGFSAIILPPMSVQDRSRMAILNLRKLEIEEGSSEPVVSEEMGRMLLRQIMDSWHDFNGRILPRWRKLLHEAKFDARMIDTYGTLLAAAELLLTEQGMVAAGFPDNLGDGMIYAPALIEQIQHATKAEIADQEEKWETVLDKLLSARHDNWKSGEKPTVGDTLERFEKANVAEYGIDLAEARHRLNITGLSVIEAGKKTQGYALAVPRSHDELDKIFERTEFRDGNWFAALKQAPDGIVPARFVGSTVKIGYAAKHCLLVDMDAYRKWRG